jgi:hypothetical protein
MLDFIAQWMYYFEWIFLTLSILNGAKFAGGINLVGSEE